MFKVTFCCISAGKHVISISNPPAGLKAIDTARAELGPDIVKVRLQGGYYEYEVMCDVTEAQARRAPHQFGEKWGACVRVLPGALNGCVVYRWQRSPHVDTIAVMSPIIDREAIVEGWLSAGAPTEWVPPDGYEPSASPEEDE
jgi:hypothetical protein